jgi:hypothetical protein
MAEAACIDPQLLLVCIVLSLKQWCAAMLGCTALWTSWNRKDTVGSSNCQQHWCKLPQGTPFLASKSSDATDITAWTVWALGLNSSISEMFLYALFVLLQSQGSWKRLVSWVCVPFIGSLPLVSVWKLHIYAVSWWNNLENVPSFLSSTHVLC